MKLTTDPKPLAPDLPTASAAVVSLSRLRRREAP